MSSRQVESKALSRPYCRNTDKPTTIFQLDPPCDFLKNQLPEYLPEYLLEHNLCGLIFHNRLISTGGRSVQCSFTAPCTRWLLNMAIKTLSTRTALSTAESELTRIWRGLQRPVSCGDSSGPGRASQRAKLNLSNIKGTCNLNETLRRWGCRPGIATRCRAHDGYVCSSNNTLTMFMLIKHP